MEDEVVPAVHGWRDLNEGYDEFREPPEEEPQTIIPGIPDSQASLHLTADAAAEPESKPDTSEPVPVAIAFEQRILLLVKTWPQWTVFPEDAIRHLHIYHAEFDPVDADLIHFKAANGWADYLLRRDLPPHAEGLLAELQDGSTDEQLAAGVEFVSNIKMHAVTRGRIVAR